LYPVITIADDLAEVPETLGTKEKFWIRLEGQLHLLKFGREGTGEDWAEKVACELCSLLELPHAHYELADLGGKSCVISPSMIEEGARLVLGNELINRVTRQYDGTATYHQREHTVSRVLASLATFTAPNYADTWKTFSGYLMLDAWIGNTDRHHENWGLIIDKDQKIRLAPTFDHASSLGRELTDQVRTARMETKDERYSVAAFALKARSALYNDPTDKRPLSPFDAFTVAARPVRAGALELLDRLGAVSSDDVNQILQKMPATHVSDPAKQFAAQLLSVNRERLLELRCG
jgi:hypothetical protein